MSKLLAVQCGNSQMLPVRDSYDMDMFEQALVEGRPVDVMVYVLEYDEDRIVTIRNLRRERNGWGGEHIVGLIVEQGNIIRATLHDNPIEAHPLSLK